MEMLKKYFTTYRVVCATWYRMLCS